MNGPKRFLLLFMILSLFFCAGASGVSLSDIETAILRADYANAERLAQSFIDKKPSKSEFDQGLYYLALSQLYQGQYKKAAENFNLLLSGFPKGELVDNAYFGFIDALYLQGDFAAGLDIAERYYAENPKSESLSLLYLKLARGNLKLAQWKKAKEFLRKIIREFPDSLEAHLAKQLLEEKRYFAVQVGAFLEQGHARELIDEFKQKGEYAYMVETVDRDGRKFFRVRVGKFASLPEAEHLQAKLAGLGYPTQIYP